MIIDRAQLKQGSSERKGAASVQLRLGETSPAFPPLLADASVVAERPPDRNEISGGKGSIFYRAHSYHTKVPPEGICRLIEHYSDPGDWVLDPFCGSGMTGVACLMTGRQGLLSDLSPAAVHIARNYTSPTDPAAFAATATNMLRTLSGLERNIYGTRCAKCAAEAVIEYTVWSDVFGCPGCDSEITFWVGALDPDTGSVGSTVHCGSCGSDWPKRVLRWRSSTPVLESIRCLSCRDRRQEPISEHARVTALSFDRSQIASWYPTALFEESREMWRGQHRDQDIATAADFYTPRNLQALATVWEHVNGEPDARLRDALRFLFTAVVNRASKRYQWNAKRPTNVLSSTMYLASLSYEFNVFSLLRRKVVALTRLFETTSTLPGRADVQLSAAQTLSHIPDRSIGYVFTDPPFGSNIFYGDSSFLWEAWLGEVTDIRHEAVVNRSVRPEQGGKSVQDYEKLMTGAFEESSRVLRRDGWMSVMFHNSDDQVWSALERSIENVGFEVRAAVAFDKRQASFKGIKGQLAGERVPSFDLVLHLRQRSRARREVKQPTPAAVRLIVAERLRQHVATAPAKQRSTPYLHSLSMRVLLEEGLPLQGFTYEAVQSLCAELFEWNESVWRPKERESTVS